MATVASDVDFVFKRECGAECGRRAFFLALFACCMLVSLCVCVCGFPMLYVRECVCVCVCVCLSLSPFGPFAGITTDHVALCSIMFLSRTLPLPLTRGLSFCVRLCISLAVCMCVYVCVCVCLSPSLPLPLPPSLSVLQW